MAPDSEVTPTEVGAEDGNADPVAAPPLTQRIKTTVATAKDKAEETRKRVEASRPEHPSVDIAFCTYERDLERGGGLLAGALAYRFFLWMLPFVLVLVGGLGFLAAADESAPQDLAKQAGVLGVTARSISEASANAERTRFWALLIGLPALYFASIGFVKALMVAHSLVWGTPHKKLTRKPLAAAVMTGVLVGTLVLLGLENHVRRESSGPGIVATMLFILAMAGLWLFIAWCLPHQDASLWDLVPGALVVATGIQAVHVVTVYYVARKVTSSSSTYGGLGAATAILLSLYLLARVVIFGAALNAELWGRRQQRTATAAS